MSGQPITCGGAEGLGLLGKYATAVAEIEAVRKSHTADAGTYEYSYANLADTMAAVHKALATVGCVFTQNVSLSSTDAGDWVTVATTVYDTTNGAWLTWEPLHVKPGADPQKMGSAITYAKRYALTALFSIPTVDDDGVEARQSIEEDTAELVALADRTKRANKLLPIMKGLDDEQKATLKSVVWDEIARQIMPAQLHEDEEMLDLVETTLSNMGVLS